MNLDERARKAAAAIEESVRNVETPAHAPAPPRIRPTLRYGMSFAILAMLVAGLAVFRSLPEPPPVAEPPEKIEARIVVGSLLDDISLVVFSENAAWLANRSRAEVKRIDTARNIVAETIPVQRDPSGITSGFGAIWVSSLGSESVSRIDITTSAVQTIPIGDISSDIDAGEGAVWVTTAGGGLVRIDPATRKPVVQPMPFAVRSAAVGGGFVWVGRSDTNGIARLDPKTLRVSMSIPFADSDFDFHVGPDGTTLWAAGRDEQPSIYRITTAGVIRRVPIPDTSGPLEVAGGQIWGLSRATDEFVRMDPASGKVTRRIPTDLAIAGLHFGDDSLWVTTFKGELLRISLD